MNATFVFLAGLVIKGSMVLLLGFVAARCLRAVSAACRSLAWLAVFAVMAVLPVGGFVDPVWSLPVVKVTRTAPVVMPAIESQSPSLQTNADIFTARPVEDAHAAVRWDARFVCFAGYFAGVIALLASRLMGSWQLRDIRRSGRRAEEKIEKLVRQLAAERGVTRSVSVLISDRISVPMTWGMARPVIALPSAVDAWRATELRAALRHEIAHIAHRDAARRWLSTIVCAIWWPHPLVWLAARDWRLQQEQACDDAVLRLGADAHDYAAQLLHAASRARLGRLPSAAALVMAVPSGLESRLRSVVDQRTSRSEARTAARFIALALSATACAACLLFGAQAADASADGRLIQLRSKFIEIADDSEALNDPEVKRWLGKKSAILTEAEMDDFMRRLAQKKGADIMSAPTVSAKPNQEARVETVREFIYPTEFTMDPKAVLPSQQKAGGRKVLGLLTPKTFEMMPLGIMLDARAEFTRDHIAVKSLKAVLNEFDGFAKVGPADMQVDEKGVWRVKKPDGLAVTTPAVQVQGSDGPRVLAASTRDTLKAAMAGTKLQPDEAQIGQFTTHEWSGEATLKSGEWRLASLEFKSGRKSAKPRHLLVLFSADEAKDEKASSQTDDFKTDANTETLLQKARGIVLPVVEFQNASLPDAIVFLREQSRQLDPSKQGINIFIRNDPPNTTRITLSLKDVPLNEALRHVSGLSGMNLKWEPFAAVLTPVGEPEGHEMFTLVFRMPGDLLDDAKDVKKWLESQSILFPKGAEVTFDTAAGRLTMKNVPRELRRVESLLEVHGINTAPPVLPKPASLQHADQIIFPAVKFRAATVTEAVEFLTARSRELDPQKKGIPVTLVGDAARTANQLTLDLHEVPMSTALKYIATLAGLQVVASETEVQLTATPPLARTPPFEVTSREAQSDPAKGTYVATGDVATEVGGFKIKAGKLSYDSKAGIIEITDTFELRNKTTVTTSKGPSSRATIHVKTGVLRIDGPVSTKTSQ